MKSSFRHIGFVVRDLEKSLKFYRDLLGFTIYKRMEETGEYIDKLVGIRGVRVGWVKLNIPGGGLLELLEYHSHPDPAVAKPSADFPSNRLGASHIALTVPNLDELYEKLTKSGYRCNSQPLLAPGGKTKILYCHDPDGIILELIEDLPPSV